MENQRRNIFNKYLNTKRKKIIAGSVAGLLLVAGVGAYSLTRTSDTLVLTKNQIDAELGQVVSTDVADYLNYNKIDSKTAEKIIKDAKSTNNFKYVTVENKDENGNVISKEQKEYPEVGKYKINFSYKDEKETVEVTVEDTTKPVITTPDSIDVIQYTDLATFNFAELLQVTDYSDVNDWQIDTSKVDVNTLGTYDLKISISDVEKNKAEKEMKINVVEAPIVAEGEVAVTEIVTDENGNKKTVVTKKSSSEVSSKDNITTGKPVENTNKVESGSGNSATKPSTPSGSTGGNTGNNGGNSNSGNTGDNKPAHSHSWEAVTKTVHHEAETKTVHHDAVTKTETVTVVDKEAWDEPIYESRYICNRCGFSTKDGDEISGHLISVCGGGCHVGKVQIDTIHHDAVTHQEERTVVIKEAWDETIVVKPAWDETVTTGYKCSCGATKNK
ncbi:hypothetical protein [Thomasclavelia ramosa]|uniref:hypothetical protein n=1 Tax=Thomasclavelia ramosa TaxID=1547 RepID=UPI001C2C4961|nr:hypothetical protein [Thomasclavelia ramosa]MBU9878123.1 hypothetical protein [Thomasclavelia ramosa]MBV4098346.1 hypothetical protein [Thomasclavelia ramosa]MBV4120037.1 hypothetical protein [Thomasclavelia ramosa]